MRPTLLVVLQCPWKRGSITRWHPSVWRREFLASRTGRRLFSEVIPKGLYRVHFVNANPTLAETADGVFPPNLRHVKRQVGRIAPNVILVCGRVAKEAISGLVACGSVAENTPIVAMPHPAFRGLSRDTTASTKAALVALHGERSHS